MKDELRRAAEYWSRKQRVGSPVHSRWWQHATISRHINKRICGESVDGVGAGLRYWIRRRVEDLPLTHGLSIGCGNATKEINLIREGIVEYFSLYEIAEERIKQGVELASRAGIEDRITFHNQDPFLLAEQPRFDLVYWDNSLHHMLDVARAIEFSRQVLKPNGFLVMDDFVGPSRFQWTDRNLEIATRVRESLAPRFLVHPKQGQTIPTRVMRPSAERLIADDPTEAADSSRILDELRRNFPDIEIKMTGGAVYHLALNDVLANFTDDDTPLLKVLLLVDDLASELGENHYAAAIAQKIPSQAQAGT